MRIRPWSRNRGDDGFTLLELTVAMLVIAVVIVTLVALQLSSMKTVAVARQRQTATALADQKLERLRALPYTTIQSGLLSSDPTLNSTDDTRYAAGRLGGTWNEALVTSSTQSNVELVPHKQKQTLNGVDYFVYTYITKPKNADGSDSTSTVDFWLTVVSQWKSPSTGNRFKSVVVRTRATYPAGCNNDDVTHPYAGPCQPFLYGQSGRSAGSISISAVDSSTAPISSLDFTNASVIFSNYSSETSVEQTTSSVAKAFNSGTKIDSANTGQDATTAAADIDPGTAAATGPFNVPVPSSSGATRQISGTSGVLSLLNTGMAAGSGVQSAVASTTAGNCQDLSGTVLNSLQACAAAQVGRVGGNEADLDLSNFAGRDLPAFALAAMTPDSTAARSYSGRFLTAYNGHCTNTTGDGCVAVGSSRLISSLVAGALPAGSGGDQLPNNFSGMVTGSNLSDSVSAETGYYTGGVNATGSAPVPTGTLQYWNGNGYTTVNLATSNTYSLPAVTASYMTNGNPAITIAMSGALKVTAASTTTTLNGSPANCQPTACTAKAQGVGIVADVTYQIMSGINQVAYFTVELNLGRLIANATYRAVPSA